MQNQELTQDQTEVFRTIVVEDTIVNLVRQLATALPSGLGMFVAGYSSTGEPPATHYVSEGYMWNMFAEALSSPENLVEMLANYGQTMPIEQATLILSKAVISSDEASTVVNSLGLKPVGSSISDI